MGLNLNIDHVAFSSLKKFDGRIHRKLNLSEIGQIAGRAGRFQNDGTFGLTEKAFDLDPISISANEFIVDGNNFNTLNTSVTNENNVVSTNFILTTYRQH